MAFDPLIENVFQDNRGTNTQHILEYNGQITKAFRDVELKLFYYEMAKE